MIYEKVNSLINNNLPSPSRSPSPLLSYIVKSFQDSIITKRFRLGFDIHDDTFPPLKVLEMVRTWSGVNYAYIDAYNINEIEGEGTCNLIELMRDLNKLVKANIISFLEIS